MIKKTHLLTFLMVLLWAPVFISCSGDDDDDDPDEWVKAPDFEGLPRSGSVGFTIGNYEYITTGYGTNSTRFTDTWRYDASTGTWDEVAPFPGAARNNAVSFVSNGKAYVGLGTNSNEMFKDFYEFDPTQGSVGTWKKIDDFPGAGRWGAVAFSLNEVGYVGTGRDGDAQDYNDFYSYKNGTWTKSISTPAKRSFAFVFVLNNLAYLGGGTNNNSNVVSLYTFDGTNWAAKKDLSGRDDDYTYNLTRLSPATFVVNGQAYISGGLSSYSGSAIGTTWRYDASGDYWVEHQAFLGSYRQQPVAFTINNRAYVSTGRSGTLPFDDTWEFIPQSE
ncbi:N-acetylneuraminic acid mutarotase [bacterium A37T11]|nr:N-acetylneuraminic acid mutarotase [bacterium A37T11]